jgi:hypothetical protein
MLIADAAIDTQTTSGCNSTPYRCHIGSCLRYPRYGFRDDGPHVHTLEVKQIQPPNEIACPSIVQSTHQCRWVVFVLGDRAVGEDFRYAGLSEMADGNFEVFSTNCSRQACPRSNARRN